MDETKNRAVIKFFVKEGLTPNKIHSDGYFADLTKNHYRDGIMALEHR
jgi:hypothetical protein